jgi:hypothetical protein
MIYTIYKISIGEQDYIGSTRDLKQRKTHHKYDCNTLGRPNYNFQLYQNIRNNGGWDCCIITPIEEFDCETKRQAECREEYWRREYKATLNTNRAYRTEDELKEQKKINTKKANKKINEKKKLEEPVQCHCGGKYKKNKNRHLKSKKHLMYLQTNEGATDCESE